MIIFFNKSQVLFVFQYLANVYFIYVKCIDIIFLYTATSDKKCLLLHQKLEHSGSSGSSFDLHQLVGLVTTSHARDSQFKLPCGHWTLCPKYISSMTPSQKYSALFNLTPSFFSKIDPVYGIHCYASTGWKVPEGF